MPEYFIKGELMTLVGLYVTGIVNKLITGIIAQINLRFPRII